MDYDEKPDPPNRSRDSWFALVQEREHEILKLRKVVEAAKKVVAFPTYQGMAESLACGEVQDLIDALKELERL